MNLLTLSLSHFLHLLATVIWIGGIMMILLVILPVKYRDFLLVLATNP